MQTQESQNLPQACKMRESARVCYMCTCYSTIIKEMLDKKSHE